MRSPVCAAVAGVKNRSRVADNPAVALIGEVHGVGLQSSCGTARAPCFAAVVCVDQHAVGAVRPTCVGIDEGHAGEGLGGAGSLGSPGLSEGGCAEEHEESEEAGHNCSFGRVAVGTVLHTTSNSR